MNTYAPFNQPQSYQGFSQNQFFAQPQGNIYVIGNSNEAPGILTNLVSGAAICPKENVLYFKTYQNGVPVVLGYKLSLIDPQADISKESQVSIDAKINNALADFDKRMKSLENQIATLTNPKGGKVEWPTI